MTKDFIVFFQYGGLGGEKTTGQRLMRKFFFSLVLRKKRFVCGFRDLPGATIIVKTSFSLFSP